MGDSFSKKNHVLRVSFYKHQFKKSAANLSLPQTIKKEEVANFHSMKILMEYLLNNSCAFSLKNEFIIEGSPSMILFSKIKLIYDVNGIKVK